MNKSINEMTLMECLDMMRRIARYQISPVADRIHELTRWIPVTERLPDEGDIIDGWNEYIGCRWSDLLYVNGEFRQPANRHGVTHHQGVTLSHYQGGSIAIVMPTHWRRIDPPETKPQ